MVDWLRVRDDLRGGKRFADVLLWCWERRSGARLLGIGLRWSGFVLWGNRVADKFLGRLDVENWSRKEALLLAIGLYVFGDVRFILRDALDQFTADRKNVPEVVLVLGSSCSVIWSPRGSKIGSSLLNESSLDWAWNFYEVTSDSSLAIIVLESGLLRLLG